MKTILYNNKKIEVYDDIEDMPIVNFQKYNKYLLIDSGVGSDVDDIDAHIIKVAKLIGANDQNKALQELQNMRQNMYMVNCEISPKYLAFAALIKSVDGKEVTDLSDDGLKALLQSINKIKHSTIIDFLSRFKKKITEQLRTYFPVEFGPDSKEKDYYDKYKWKTIYELQQLIEKKDYSREISDIERILFEKYKPNIFYGSNSIEIAHDKKFESSCLIISQKMNTDAKKMTVLQFYNALALVKAQLDAETKSIKKRK